MNRPEKHPISIENFHPDQVMAKVCASQNIIVGTVYSVCGTACHDKYFEPVAILMTEAVFYEIIKHPDSDHYLNRYSGEHEWTFMGLPMAAVKSQIGNFKEQWIQVV